MQKSMSISGIEIRSGLRNRSKSRSYCQRIDVGNLQRVAHQAARGRSAPRPYRHSLRARVADEIPDDQEVAGEAHLLDHLDFIGKPPLVLAERVTQPSFFGQTLELLRALSESFARHALEIRIRRVSFGNLELRERIHHALDLQVATRGDGYRAVESASGISRNTCAISSAVLK